MPHKAVLEVTQKSVLPSFYFQEVFHIPPLMFKDEASISMEMGFSLQEGRRGRWYSCPKRV